MKLRLIESRASCGYTRCGRTDKGVSAVGQVVALRLRSNIPPVVAEGGGESSGQMKPQDVLSTAEEEESVGKGGEQKATTVVKVVEEMDYCSMLNKSLPEEIRILGWCEVSDGFSARFSAVSRTYRYFFVRKNLNLSAMQAAASLLEGEHDFRNICKMDVANVSNFRRRILHAAIVWHSGGVRGGSQHEDTAATAGYEEEVWMLEITGVAFLWHMVRCIMSILFLVGEGKEAPHIISALVDIDRVPAKPEYFMAPVLPLVLYSSGFENLTFSYQTKNLFSLMSHFETLFDKSYLAAVRIRNVVNFLKEVNVERHDLDDFFSYMRVEKKIGCVLDGDSTSGCSQNETTEMEKEVADSVSTSISASMKWHVALHSLISQGIVPSPQISTKKERNNKFQRANFYMPLLERTRAEPYDTRILQLTGNKRILFDEHNKMKTQGALPVSSSSSSGDEMEVDSSSPASTASPSLKTSRHESSQSDDFFRRMRCEGSTK